MIKAKSIPKTIIPALLSGFSGATASCFAKYAFDRDSVIVLQTRQICEELLDNNDTGRPYCYWIEIILARGLCLLCMIGCNVYMLGSFIKGMEEYGSVAGTALSTASNFFVSAFYGYVLWGERFTTIWYMGFTMVITGVLILSSSPSTNKHNALKKED